MTTKAAVSGTPDGAWPDHADRYRKVEAMPGKGLYKARDSVTGELVLVKKVPLENEYDGMPAHFIREISILRTLLHPNIVDLKDVVPALNGNIRLVFELIPDRLSKLLYERKEKIDPEVVKSYLHQMLSAVQFCHGRSVMHRDLKPRNMLITSDGTIKLSEFGLARTFELPLGIYTHEVVTLWYRPPEILLGAEHYSPAVDIWSLGCIFAEMVLGKPFMAGDCEIDQLFQIFRVFGTPTEQTWPGVSSLRDFKATFPSWTPQPLSSLVDLGPTGLDLLSQMLQCNPQRRISSHKALQHPFFENYELEQRGKRRREDI